MEITIEESIDISEDDVYSKAVYTLFDWVTTLGWAALVFVLLRIFVGAGMHFELFASRIVNAIIGASSLIIYWWGCRLRKKNPESMGPQRVVQIGKVFILIWTVNGYVNAYLYLAYKLYLGSDTALTYMGAFVTVVLIVYVFLSNFIKKKYFVANTSSD